MGQGDIFKNVHFNSIYKLAGWALAVKPFSWECHRTSLIRNQHWLKHWLGAVRQRNVIRSHVDPDLSPYGFTRPRWVKSYSVFKKPCLVAIFARISSERRDPVHNLYGYISNAIICCFASYRKIPVIFKSKIQCTGHNWWLVSNC